MSAFLALIQEHSVAIIGGYVIGTVVATLVCLLCTVGIWGLRIDLKLPFGALDTRDELAEAEYDASFSITSR